MIDIEIASALDGERVDRVVAMMTALSRSDAATLIADGGVALDGRVVTNRSQRVSPGSALHIAFDPDSVRAVALEPDVSVEVDVIFENDDVIVVNKPAGLVVHPGSGNATGTLAQGLLARFPELGAIGQPDRPGIVHRLDRNTSGLLAVARSARGYASLSAQMMEHTAERRYVALVWGIVHAESGLIDAPLGRSGGDPTRRAVRFDGKEARTRYRVVTRFDRPVTVSLLHCTLETGRTHQIRAHLKAIGHAVVGDSRYGGTRPEPALDRPFLHAAELAFNDPGSGVELRFEVGLPSELTDVLATLRAI